MAAQENVAGKVPEAIERFFQFALYLMVLSGFVMLASTGKLDPVSLVIIFVALAARGRLLYLRREVLLSDQLTNWLTLAYVLFYAADFLFLSGSYLTATVHLLLFAMGVKLFSVSRERDYVYLAALSFGMVLSAAVLTVDSVFLFGFAFFMVLATATFVAMEMRRSARDGAALPVRQPLTLRRVGASLVTTAIVLVVAVLIFASGFFFSLPRLSGGYLSRFAPHSALVTGFSNEVQLGKIGEIQQSDELVMHIQIDGDANGSHAGLLWRGMALNSFDGRQWRSSNSRTTLSSDTGRFDLQSWRMAVKNDTGEPGNLGAGWKTIHYRVLAEPVGMDVFFLAPVPYSLTSNFKALQMDSSGAIFSDGSHFPAAYDATSNIALPRAALLQESPRTYPAAIALNNLQLPVLDPRVTGLAAQVTAGAGNDFDRARALEAYLRNNFKYTLQLPVRLPKDPIANFLFERRMGHCEYFASSMTVMLRSLGIPARVVNGFRNGEFNDVTGMYIVRARDAHSWVEAYFANVGWVTFDPTPAASFVGGAESSRWHRMALYVDAMGEFWREWVVNYDYQRQMDLSFRTMLKAQEANRRGFNWWKSGYDNLLDRLRQLAKNPPPAKQSAAKLAGLLALLLLGINIKRLLRQLRERKLMRDPAAAPALASSLIYERLLRQLARRGHRKLPQQTPTEFAQNIPEERLRQRVESFTASYEHARFGQSAAEADKLPELYEEVIAK